MWRHHQMPAEEPSTETPQRTWWRDCPALLRCTGLAQDVGDLIQAKSL